MATLGIDLGTTAVKAAIVVGGRAVRSHEEETAAYYPEVQPSHSEQDVHRILATVHRCIAAVLVSHDAPTILGVSLSCQMHGVVCWNSSSPEATAGPLITWEDRRCGEGLIRELNGLLWASGAAAPAFSGYGSATLVWLRRSGGLALFDRCGSIGAFVAASLTGWADGARPAVMELSDAAAWGGTAPTADTSGSGVQEAEGGGGEWLPVLAQALLPMALPRIVRARHVVGLTLSPPQPLLPPGLPVHAAIGDHPAVVATAAAWAHAALGDAGPPPDCSGSGGGGSSPSARRGDVLIVNLGTSAQAALVGPRIAVRLAAERLPPLPAGAEVRPFPGVPPEPPSRMLVGAGVNGGNFLKAAATALAPRVRSLLQAAAPAPAAAADDDVAEGAADGAGAAGPTADGGGLAGVFAFLELNAENAVAGAVREVEDGDPLLALDPAALLLPERTPIGWPPAAAAPGAEGDGGGVTSAGAAAAGGAVQAALASASAKADAASLGRWYLRCIDCVVGGALARLPRELLIGGSVDAVIATGGVFARSPLARRRLERAVDGLAEGAGGVPPRLLWLPQDVAAYAGAIGAALCSGHR